jgi:4-hydroxythreonine-4-phosphate dehydrogenase
MRPLAVSTGDPAGIGPEIIAKAWDMRVTAGLTPFCVVGPASIWNGPVAVINDLAEVDDAFNHGLPVLNEGFDDHKGAPGKPSEASARIAYQSLTTTAELVIAGKASALVTAPVSKSQLVKLGFAHPGQTEYIASLMGFPPNDAVMMLAGPSLKVALATIHLPLSSISQALTRDLIINRARITAEALTRDFGIQNPRIAIAGLNPHAGENGAFGDEERTVIAPAIAALKAMGINAFGPVVPDALFTPRARMTYDVAFCMYHDQGLIPIKALDFDDGVNMTLGLPIIRTSPDHGTAFDIAGQNIAHPGAMIAALRMAAEAAQHRANA